MQGLWKTKKTGYVKDYKIRKIKRKHFLKDKAKHIINSLSSPSFILEFKRKENKYLTIKKEEFLTVYLVKFKEDNKLISKKGFIHPVSKEFIFDENNFFKFDRERFLYNKEYSLFSSIPEDLRHMAYYDRQHKDIYSIEALGLSKNLYFEDINNANNSFKQEDLSYYNNSYFYNKKLIDKNFYHQLIAKAHTGDSKFDIDGLTKEEKKRIRRIQSKSIIKQELDDFLSNSYLDDFLSESY